MSDMNEAPTTPQGGDSTKYGTGPKAEPARKSKDMPVVKSETIVRHGHVV